jgi:catechol 2,3-dioxygenase-like lactoylglutathione lyase family enzyme
MKKGLLIFLITATSFCFGFAFKTILTDQSNDTKVKKVTGIGGIFFKCKDPKKLRAWYKTHLGLKTNPYGSVFEWRQGADSTKKGFTQWSPFVETTKYFEPSTRDFMINYRVENLEELLVHLKKDGVTITDKVEAV